MNRGGILEYQKIEKKGFNLHFIKTNRFKKNMIRLTCKRPLKIEEITVRNIVTDILLNSNKEYPSIRDIVIETEELYNFSASSNCYKSGNYVISSWDATFLNEKYTEEGMTEKSVCFFMNLLFNPNVTDGAFNTDAFVYTKNCLKNVIDSIKDNPSRYSQIRMKEFMYPDSIISARMDGYIEDLEKVTEKIAYEYYRDMFKNDVIDIFVLGDFDSAKMEQYIEKYVLLNRMQPVYSLPHIIESKETSHEIQIHKETMHINQSKLAIGLKIYDMDDYERKYTLQALAYILGGSGDSKLFRKVRGENSLCYYISASPSMLYSYMVITSGIDKQDFEKAVDLIKESICEVQSGKITAEELENGINTYINSCMEMYDSPSSIINSYLSREYLNTDTIEEKMNQMEKMTIERIVTLARKLKIDTIYLLEGDSTDEK